MSKGRYGAGVAGSPSCFVGVDCSSKAVHFVCLDSVGAIRDTHCLRSKKKGSEERFYDLVAQLGGEFLYTSCWHAASVAAVESAIYVQNMRSTITIAQVVAGVKVFLRGAGVSPIFAVDNRVWKKDVLGRGDASKEQIKEFAVRRFGMSDELEQDYYDAACIALWGYRRFSPGRSVD